MLENKYIDLLRDIIHIPSFSGEETAVCDYLEHWLLSEGLCPIRRGNNLMLGKANSNKPTILLNAHIDTVRPASSYTRDPFTPSVEGDVLYGLGSNDDGGSLVTLLAVYMSLCKTAQPYNLLFTSTAEEENSGRGGIEMLFADMGKVSLGIIGEPTKMRLAVAEKGLMVLDCKAYGKAGHAAREEGVNAIYKAIEDIRWFEEYQFEKKSDFLGPVKMTVTQIEAGRQHNQVPDLCSFVVDVRSNGIYSNTEVLATIKQHVSCDVNARSTRLNPSHIDLSHPVVRRAGELGIQCFGSPTMSNQSLLSFPTVKIGPGDSARSHSADEYIKLSELSEGLAIYTALLDNLSL